MEEKGIEFRTAKQLHELVCMKGDMEMGAMKENPRYNVVSIRVSDEELEALQEVCKETNKSISTVVREAMSLVRANAQGLLYDGMMLRT